MDNNQKDRIMNKFIYLLACTLFVSCQNNNKSSVTQMEVELDSMWCTRLMPGLGSGVTGGDGAISIDLKDGRNLFMWGDSFFGDVVDDKRSKDSKFVMGNTFTIINEKGFEESFCIYTGRAGWGFTPLVLAWRWICERWYSSFVHVQVQESG